MLLKSRMCTWRKWVDSQQIFGMHILAENSIVFTFEGIYPWLLCKILNKMVMHLSDLFCQFEFYITTNTCFQLKPLYFSYIFLADVSRRLLRRLIGSYLALDGLVVLPRSVHEELIQYTEKSYIATDMNVL